MSSTAPMSPQQQQQQSFSPQPTVHSSPQQDMDLMVADLVATEEVVTEVVVVSEDSDEVLSEEEVITTTATTTAPVVAVKSIGSIGRLASRILLTISDDLSYAMPLIGDSFDALLDSISADDQLKSEWHSWQRFVSNPKQFFVYIFDDQFGQYIRFRDGQRIPNLAKIKIKNKFYVNQSPIRRFSSHNNGPIIDDVLDTEPTDALVSDQPLDSNGAADGQRIRALDLNSTSNIPNDINHNVLNSSQYHHNYHISSPSAPAQVGTPAHTITSSSTCTALSEPLASAQPPPQQISNHNTRQTTKASKKLFTNIVTVESATKPLKASKSNASSVEANDIAADLLADTPTGPIHEWTQEQIVTFLESAKTFAKELAPKKNVLEVRPNIWEQLAKDLNAKGFGYFDALMCRNKFSQLRMAYTNILCYPHMASETRWPYFEHLKQIIGEKPLEMQRQVKTRAQSAKAAEKVGRRLKRSHRKPSGSIMKNSANQEVSELYVALLNLVKKYMKYFETEKKNQIWTRIEKEMNAAGYKWTWNALRALFHRLRYTYLNILRSVGDEELATASWPYFRYFQNLDLTAFRSRKSDEQPSKRSAVKEPKLVAKRRPGRPRKIPPVADNNTDSQYTSADETALGNELTVDRNCVVQFYEYNSDSSAESPDSEGRENQKKLKSES